MRDLPRQLTADELAELFEGRTRLVELLDKMEATLKTSAWLAGPTYSIADIAVVPFVKLIDEEIAPDQVTPAAHPRVTEWWTTIQARPAFARARIGPFVTEAA